MVLREANMDIGVWNDGIGMGTRECVWVGGVCSAADTTGYRAITTRKKESRREREGERP